MRLEVGGWRQAMKQGGGLRLKVSGEFYERICFSI